MIILKKMFLIAKIKIFKFLRRDVVDLKIKLFRMRGYKIGSNCRIFTELSGAEPYLVTIGDNVTISTNVVFLTHDNAIIKASKKEYTDLFGKIIIGDNSFIGANAIIMPGVSLAAGTVVAAGSVVTKSVAKDDMVIGGNPAKIICTTKDYLEKNKRFGFNCSNLNRNERKQYIIKNEEKLLKKSNLK